MLNIFILIIHFLIRIHTFQVNTQWWICCNKLHVILSIYFFNRFLFGYLDSAKQERTYATLCWKQSISWSTLSITSCIRFHIMISTLTLTTFNYKILNRTLNAVNAVNQWFFKFLHFTTYLSKINTYPHYQLPMKSTIIYSNCI